MHHAQVVLTAAVSHPKQVAVSFAAVPTLGSLELKSGVECEEQSLSAQRSQDALQVQQVGGAVADASVRVGQPVDKRASV